jgi:hypothetical protein
MNSLYIHNLVRQGNNEDILLLLNSRLINKNDHILNGFNLLELANEMNNQELVGILTKF